MGCSSSSSAPNTDGGGGGDGSAVEAGKSGADSCGQALTCIANCPANDDACANACFDDASPAGQQKLLALVDCITTNKCMDATCAKTSCTSQVDACVQDAPADVDSGIPPMMGTPLPAELVGTWQKISSQVGQDYTFKADGSYSSLYLYDNTGTCITIAKLSTSIDGVAAVQGSTLTLTPTAATQTTTDCSNVATMKPAHPPVLQFTWSVAGTMLTLTNADGSQTFTKM